jgi:ABC-type ATPase with predicted acetyltransferase domain
MATYYLSKTLHWRGRVSEKAAAVMRMFGLTMDRLRDTSVTHRCQVEISDGDILFITGPSGAGKTLLLRELEKMISASDRVDLAEIELPAGKTLIDCIDGDLITSLRTLDTAGLNDVFCILNKPSNLSEGQKYRFRLAMALAMRKKFIFADEFCSNLDRIMAAVIAYNVRRFAKRTGTVFVLATSHEDILPDLEPDVLVVKELSGETEVIYKSRQRCSHEPLLLKEKS